jgi:hypothetical protein
MKKLSIFLYFTLISYVFSAHTANLKTGQTFPVGNSITFIIEVTPDSETLTLTGFSGKLQNGDGSVKAAFTCTDPETDLTAKTELSCTVSLSDPGTYKLSSDSWDITGKVGEDDASIVAGDGTMEITEPPQPSKIKVDIFADQTLKPGNNKDLVLTITPTGAAIKVSSISGIQLSLSGEATTVSITCTITEPINCAAGEATNIPCQTGAISSEGNYVLSGTLAVTGKLSDGTTNIVTTNTDLETGNTALTVSNDAVEVDILTAVKVDIKGSQTIKTGTDVEFKLTVTPTGASIKVTVISGLELVLSSSSSTKTTITCTIASSTTCTKNTATDFTCKAASITTEGTYKLGGTLTFTATKSDDSSLGVEPSIGTNTLTVSNSSGEESKPNTSKYLNISFSLFLMLLFF